MCSILQIPNSNTSPGEPIQAWQAKAGYFYYSEKTRCVLHCVEKMVFFQLNTNRYFAETLETMYPVRLDSLTIGFSFQNSLPKWDEDKDWIKGPDCHPHMVDDQPKTHFQIKGVIFSRYNVKFYEAQEIASTFGITQIEWEKTKYYYVDGKWKNS